MLAYARHQPGGGELDPGEREQDPEVNLENQGANRFSNLKKTLAGPKWTGICLVLGFASSVREALDWFGSKNDTFICTSAIISHLPVSGASITRAMVVEVMRQKLTTILICSNKVAMNGSVTFYMEPSEIGFE